MNLTYENERETYLYDQRDGLGDIMGGFNYPELWFGNAVGDVLVKSDLGANIDPYLAKNEKANECPQAQSRRSPSQKTSAKSRQLMMLGLGSVSLLVGLVFFTLMLGASDLFWLKSWLSTYFEVAFGVILALLLAAVGAINHTARFYLYAILALVIIEAGYLFEIHLGISAALLGGLIMVSGLIVLLRFLSEYPVRNE